MVTYFVKIGDNFHFQDGTSPIMQGSYGSFEEAVEICQKIVDESLLSMLKPDRSADDLYQHYCMFGDEPYVIPVPEGRAFSARKYAQSRCKELCTDH